MLKKCELAILLWPGKKAVPSTTLAPQGHLGFYFLSLLQVTIFTISPQTDFKLVSSHFVLLCSNLDFLEMVSYKHVQFIPIPPGGTVV